MRDDKVYFLELNCRRRMAETKGTGGCPWDGMLRRMGPPSSCLSISGISVCAIRLGLRRPEDGRPRDGCPWDGCFRGGCPRDGGRRRRRKTEMDVPETEGVFPLFFFNIVESFSGSHCLIIFDDSSGVCGWVVRWECISACEGAHGRKSMFCRGIYFWLLNCMTSLYEVNMNSNGFFLCFYFLF